jgi:hypothetical protein
MGWAVRHYRAARERALEVIAKKLLSMSAFKARRHLKTHGAMRILIDSSVIANGVTHESIWISTGTGKWGGRIEVNTGYLACVPVHAPTNDTILYKETRYLAGIAQLAKENLLNLYTSGELEAEKFRHPIGLFSGYGWFDYNVFRDTNIERIDNNFYLDLHNPTKTQQLRLSNCRDPLFLELQNALGPKSNLDAFHIFTAEKFQLDAFLCLDFKLIRRVRQLQNKSPFSNLKTKILLPSDLASIIGHLPFDTNLLTYITDRGPRRADLHMPDQKRRPRGEYKQ